MYAIAKQKSVREKIWHHEKKAPNSVSGFTLIELLVVIAIIGLLSSVVLSSLNSAREKARDSKRKSDIEQIAIALQLSYDKDDSYTQPENCNGDTSTGACGGSGGGWGSNSDLQDIVSDGFMSSLPVDPLNDSSFYYTYEPWNANQIGQGEEAGQYYTLCAIRLESGGSFCKSVTP
ncbi:MAG: prepilin-type N-terminal cleavage/methylation domain-containing protein [bacterium]|nr:prepilin-type N-terminal cleavage/methylation domain-containing protein [bacterium]